MPDGARSSRCANACASSARWSWRSRAAPTRRSSRGWPTTPSAPTGALAVTAVSPSLPASERGDVRGAGRALGPALAGGRDRRARQPRLRPQRRRPLLLVQGRAARGGGAARRRARRDRGARREPRRPRRPPPGPAGGGRAGRGLPAGRRRLHQGRRAGLVEGARPRDLGQAGGRVPGVPAARTARRSRSGGWPRSSGPRRGSAPSGSRSCACATTARSRGSRCPSPTSSGSSRQREAVIDAVVAAGYRWATLDLAGFRSGGFNDALPG